LRLFPLLILYFLRLDFIIHFSKSPLKPVTYDRPIFHPPYPLLQPFRAICRPINANFSLIRSIRKTSHGEIYIACEQEVLRPLKHVRLLSRIQSALNSGFRKAYVNKGHRHKSGLQYLPSCNRAQNVVRIREKNGRTVQRTVNRNVSRVRGDWNLNGYRLNLGGGGWNICSYGP
jgi:hypothetical protein